MVKRLRHRPFTAESGVRFPLRLPREKTALLPRQRFQRAISAGALVFSLTRAKPRHKLRLGENYLVILRGYARLLLSHKIFDFAGTLS